MSDLAQNGWAIEIDTDDNLTGNWDSTLVSHTPGKYILSSTPGSAALAANGSTTLGFNFDQASDSAPISISLVQLTTMTAATSSSSATTTSSTATTSATSSSSTGTSSGSNIIAAPPAPPVTASLAVTNDWGSGFTGEVTVTNTGTTAITGWEVDVATLGQMTGNWNSTIVSQSGGNTEVSNASWNGSLAAGASTTFGFNMDRAASNASIAVSVDQVTNAAGVTTPVTTSTTSTTGTGTTSTSTATAGTTSTAGSTTAGASSSTGSSSSGTSGSSGGTTSTSGTVSAGSSSGGSTTSSSTNTTGADTLVLNLAEDAYGGDAQFTVSVDGKQVGGTYTASTLRSSGTTQAVTLQGNWGPGQHTVQVALLNGYTGGTQNAVRDLYIASASLDGNLNGLGTVLQAGGSTTQFVVQPSLDTLVLGLAQAGGQGNAQVTVSVDGVATGQTYTINGQHAQGQDDQISLNGRWGAGQHIILVTDVSPANGSTSPSIFVDSATFDGSSGTIGAVLSSPGSTASVSAGGSLTVPILGSGTAASTGVTGSSSSGSTTGSSTTSGTTTSTTPSSGQFEYLGVNLSGAEFGISDPTDGNYSIGTYGTNYTYPTHAELDYYASEGLNTIRLPFSWERLQPTENGPLDKTQLGYIDDVVQYAATKGLNVVLDPHNYGYGYGNLIGSSGTPDSAFANLWSQIAGHYAGQSNVLFGLMNEPHAQTPAQWVEPVNDAISAIRATGAGQEILVPGTDWTGGDTWVSSGNASIFAANVTDPDHNFAFEIHQYSDSDGSGSSTAVVSTTIAEDRLQAVTQWAEQTGNKLFLGEFGAGSDQSSFTNTSNMLAYMQQHTDVWQGGTEWGGGPWWGNYGFATDPVNGVTTAQVALLAHFAPNHLTV